MRSVVVARQRQMMAQEGLDAVVTCAPESFAHVAGFVVPSQSLMRWRHAMVVISVDGRVGVICVDMEESTVRAQMPEGDVRIWAEFSDDPMSVLSDLLRDMGVASGVVGIELDYLPARDFMRLRGLLPTCEWRPVEDTLATLRQVKTPDELNLLRQLAKIADQAILDSFDAVKAGDSEMDLASALIDSVYRQGAESFKLMIVATGERSQLPNVGPTNRRLQPHDICRVEIFPTIDGYHAGVCRTAAVGEPPDHAQRIWQNLVECKQLLLDTIGPGVSSRKVWESFRERFDILGLPPISFVGHGIGTHLHERPYLAATEDVPLETGMVLGVEPLVYRTGHGFGMQLKDMVAVTADGCELLSDDPRANELVQIG
jgi:Xaa-Pro aminopeptidase